MKHNYFLKSATSVAAIFGALFSWGQVTTFDYTGSVDTYTVPADVSMIQIEARGAQGGNEGGLGAVMIGDFTVAPGEVLTLIVGQEGGIDDTREAGGGGGSFVANASDEPLIVAGGGGGRAWDGMGSPPFVGMDANTTTNGNDGYGSTGGSPTRIGLGGVDGNGSTVAGPGGMGHAGNGGGFYTDGAAGLCGGGGSSFLSGGAGGTGCSGGPGGFGGGANGGNWGGGGGGGYSGGGGAYHAPTNGGGGGSFNAGDNQDNTVSNTGNGQIIITVLCNALTVTVSDYEVCLGETFTLDATGDGAITWDGGVVNGEPFTTVDAGVTTYTASSDDPMDCPFTVDIEVFELPDVTASVDETEICEGETVVFTQSGDADVYTWDPADVVSGEAYMPEPGTMTYTLTGEDETTGCENTSSVEVTVNALPEVTASVDDDKICLGQSIVFTGGGAATYEWTGGVTDGGTFTPDEIGTEDYMVTGTDDNGCVNEASVEVQVKDSIQMACSVLDETLGSDGEIDIAVIGGYPAYTFDWDNDGTGDFDDTEDLTGLTGGTYVVVIEDEEGCTTTKTVVVDSRVGIDENNLIISVYPNPASEQITIALNDQFTYNIYASNGQLVANGNGFNSEVISIEDLTNGVYFIQVTSNTQTQTIEFVKQ